MKLFSKQIFFLTILLFGLFFSLTVLAADLDYGPQTPFPGFQGTGKDDKLAINSSSFGQYVGALYKYGVVLGASLAVIVMMIGGIIWLTSAGSADKIGQARGYIGGALGGLVLLLCSYLILYTINPELVELKSLNIRKVDEIPLQSSWQKCEMGFTLVTIEECKILQNDSNNNCYPINHIQVINGKEIKEEACCCGKGKRDKNGCPEGTKFVKESKDFLQSKCIACCGLTGQQAKIAESIPGGLMCCSCIGSSSTLAFDETPQFGCSKYSKYFKFTDDTENIFDRNAFCSNYCRDQKVDYLYTTKAPENKEGWCCYCAWQNKCNWY